MRRQACPGEIPRPRKTASVRIAPRRFAPIAIGVVAGLATYRRRRRATLALLTAAGVVVPISSAFTANVVWHTNSSGLFDEGANWSTGVMPGSADNAVFATFSQNPGATYDVSFFGSFNPAAGHYLVDQWRGRFNHVNLKRTLSSAHLTADNPSTGLFDRGIIVGDVPDDVSSVTSFLNTLTAGAASIATGERSTAILRLAGSNLNLIGNSGLDTELLVGHNGNGTLDLFSNTSVTLGGANGNATLGENAGSSGTLLVSGSGSTFSAPTLNVGRAGEGTLNVSGGGQVMSTVAAILGDRRNSQGTATIRGAGSSWSAGDLTVGDEGDGSLTIAEGGVVTASRTVVGIQSRGDINVGAFSTLTTSELLIGGNGGGSLNITGGGQAESGFAAVATGFGDGVVNVSGTGSTWTITGELIIGFFPVGAGTLNITDGGQVESGDAEVGLDIGSVGTINVSGAGSAWTINGNLNLTGVTGDIDGDSTLAFGLSGAGNGLITADSATLEGALEVSLLDGFELGPGDEFEILNIAGARTGQFAGLGEGALVGNFGGTDLFITYAAGDGNDVALFTAPANFAAADFDEDGDVDGDDLMRWKSGFGAGVTHMQGDADADQDADGADFLTWQRQLGGSLPATSMSAAVPEPSTVVLAAILLGGVITTSRPPRRSVGRALMRPIWPITFLLEASSFMERIRGSAPVGWKLRRLATGMLVGLAVVLAAAERSSAQFFWVNASGGHYAAAANWIPNGVPDAISEDAVYDLIAAYDVDVDANYSVGDVEVNRGDVAWRFAPQSFTSPPLMYSTMSLGVRPAAGVAAKLTLDNGDTRSNQAIVVGAHGDATLNVFGRLTAPGAALGTNPGSKGQVVVGARNTWTSAGGVVIGGAGLGQLDILAGTSSSMFGGTFAAQGDVDTASAVLGQSAGGRGEASVTGIWTTGDLVVGAAGTAEITLRANPIPFPQAHASSVGHLRSGAADIAAQLGSTAAVNVTGNAVFGTLASTWDLSGSLSVGGSSDSAGGAGRLVIGSRNEVTVGSHLRIWSGGTLAIAEEGVLEIGGAANLAGALEFTLAFSNPSLGAEFSVLTAAAGVSGVFSATTLPPLDSGLAWNVLYNPTSVALRVVSAPSFTADFDEDGDADGDDLTRWKSGFGTSATHMQGDADGDVDADGADFLAWQRQLGSGAAASSIPEPGAFALFAVACCGLALRRGRLLGNTTQRRSATSARRWGAAFLGGILALYSATLPRPASAITFTINYTENETPAFDPTGQRLQEIANAAGTIWSDYILDDRNFEFDLSWDDLDGDDLGQYQPGFLFVNTNIVLDTKDAQGQPRDWFFDSTPLANEEFGMRQTSYGDFGARANFTYPPPDVFEIGYTGSANLTSENRNQHDLLTVVLHEIGHYLGVNLEANDDQYDIRPATLGGASVGVYEKIDPDPLRINHLDVESALMSDVGLGVGQRRLPSATDILVMWDESDFIRFDLPRVDFLAIGQSTDWNATLNWIGGRVPDHDNQVFVRNGGDVWSSNAHSPVAGLVVDEGSALLMLNNNHLEVFGHVQVGSLGGERSELIVGNFLSDAPRLDAGSLTVTNGVLQMIDAEGVVSVGGDLLISGEGELKGEGLVDVGGRLSNGGQISAQFGRELTLRTSFSALDLDGPAENGILSAEEGNLRIIGPLTEDFDGAAIIGPGRTMTFALPWRMDGRLDMHGGADAASPAVLGGAAVRVGGQIETDGHAIINTTVVLEGHSFWNVEGTLSTGSISSSGDFPAFTKTGAGTLVGQMTVEGPKGFEQGVFQGSINGAGTATFRPGAVFRPSGSSSSRIWLSGDASGASLHKVGAGAAELSGEVTIANSPTVNIDAGGKVTLSAGFGSFNGSGFSKVGLGELVLSGPGTGSIRANVLGGQLTIANSAALGAGSVSLRDFSNGTNSPVLAFTEGVTFANPITLSGATLLALGNSTVTSDITPLDRFTINVPGADHTLTLSGTVTADEVYGRVTKVGAGAAVFTDGLHLEELTVVGGTLANHGVISRGPTNVLGKALLMGSGQFADVNVMDGGRLSPGASADRSEFSPAILAVEDLVFNNGRSRPELLIQLGGLAPGSGHDQLLVSGNAALAGKLAVAVPLDFSLDASQSYLVLDIAGTRSGQFDGLAEGASLGNFRGKHLFITYAAGDGNDVALYTTTPAFASDFDEDGDVDGDDLARWKIGFGRGTNNVAGSADGDGDVDGADFLAWQRQLGGSLAVTSRSANVPEPSGLAFLLASGCAWAIQRSGRFRTGK